MIFPGCGYPAEIGLGQPDVDSPRAQDHIRIGRVPGKLSIGQLLASHVDGTLDRYAPRLFSTVPEGLSGNFAIVRQLSPAFDETIQVQAVSKGVHVDKISASR